MRAVPLLIISIKNIIRDIAFNTIASSVLVPSVARWLLLRSLGMIIRRSHVSPRCFFSSPRVSIGEGVFVNYGCFFDASDWITVESAVSIGMGCKFITSTHEVGSLDRRAGRAVKAPITIGTGAWIGANVTVLPGVTIGAGAIVAAGAVVARSVPGNSLVAGVPARRVRDL